jgi:protein ImuA
MTSVNKRAAAQDQICRLHDLLERAGASPPPAYSANCISTGCQALDQLLPRGGWSRGSLVEWLADAPGSGAGMLALAAARELHGEEGVVVVIDRTGTFYPPAAAAWRLDLAGAIVVHPASDKDEQWALDQALRCEHVAAVLAWPRRLDGRTFRRLQLAAEASGAVGLLVRPAAAQGKPSWADVRLAVAPRASPGGSLRALSTGWQLSVRLLHCRGRFGKKEGEVVVEIDERTGEIHAASSRHLASELAHPAAAQ